jgi:hypothetical protein
LSIVYQRVLARLQYGCSTPAVLIRCRGRGRRIGEVVRQAHVGRAGESFEKLKDPSLDCPSSRTRRGLVINREPHRDLLRSHKPPRMACVQARYSRRLLHDHSGQRPCPTDPSSRGYSETSTTTRPTSGRHAAKAPRSGFWSPPNEELIRTPMMASKSDASSTRCHHGQRELQSEHFKTIFEVHGQVPTRGLINTQRFALGAVIVYQLALLYRHERKLEINRGLKPFLTAA